jgi:hypothetical protein
VANIIYIPTFFVLKKIQKIPAGFLFFREWPFGGHDIYFLHLHYNWHGRPYFEFFRQAKRLNSLLVKQAAMDLSGSELLVAPWK